MSLEIYLRFVAASVLLVLTPGPNIAMIVGTSLSHGTRSGLTTVAGVNLGLMLQLSVVAAGLSWIVELFAQHFDVIRYVGAAYLALLGLQQLLSRPRATDGTQPTLSGQRAFGRGLAVAFSNPKTLVFFAALLPQFLSGGEGSAGELWLLAVTFGVISAVGDSLFAVFSGQARAAISARAQRIADKVSGAILLGGAAVLLGAGRR